MQVTELMHKVKAEINKLGGYEYFMNIAPDSRISPIISEEQEIKDAKAKFDYIFSNFYEKIYN